MQIRGYKVRLPLDLLLVATANPEDYTHRGRIVSRSRTGSARRSGPITRSSWRRRSGSWTRRPRTPPGDLPVRVPTFMKEVLAALTAELRRSPHVNQQSGVSVRFSIRNLEMLEAALLPAGPPGARRGRPRVCDLPAVLQASLGRVEFDTVEEGREEGSSSGHSATRCCRSASTGRVRLGAAPHPVRRGFEARRPTSCPPGPARPVRRPAGPGQAPGPARHRGEPGAAASRPGVRPRGPPPVPPAQQGRRRAHRRVRLRRGGRLRAGLTATAAARKERLPPCRNLSHASGTALRPLWRSPCCSPSRSATPKGQEGSDRGRHRRPLLGRTPIVATFMLPAGASADSQSPWSSGPTAGPAAAPDVVWPATLVERATAIPTWDSRGFSESGGEASVGAPGFEVEDARALIDYLAGAPRSCWTAPPRAAPPGPPRTRRPDRPLRRRPHGHAHVPRLPARQPVTHLLTLARSRVSSVRFTYSRWDDTQDPLGPDVSSGDLLDAMSEDILAGEGARGALRRLLRRGIRGLLRHRCPAARLREARRRRRSG